jgi:hypothetical protein
MATWEVLMRRWLPLLALPLLPALWGFTPFTPVRNVCPRCSGPKTDVVKLTSGATLACTVVAQNDTYYVVSKFGELRALGKHETISIKWASGGGGPKPGVGDQVLLRNGVVLNGSVVDEQAGRYLVVQVGSSRHVVWFSQIQSLHKAGKEQPLTRP